MTGKKNKCKVCSDKLDTRTEKANNMCWVCTRLKTSAAKESQEVTSIND
jgi:hypothetical protein